MFSFFSIINGGLFLTCLVGMIVYTTFFSGFFRGSSYSFLGAIRCTSQSISFEVSFFFIILSIFFLINDFEFLCGGSFFFFPLFVSFFIFILVELGRPPVDFPERESETVRGYNLEYGGLFFILIFVREYGFLVF